MRKFTVTINGEPHEIVNPEGFSWGLSNHGTVYVEASCYCAALGRMAPCGWCTDPNNNPDKVLELECECGGEKHNWPHSDWCPKFT